MLIPSGSDHTTCPDPSLSRRVNANSQLVRARVGVRLKLIKKGEC